jgi:ribosomal protein S27E
MDTSRDREQSERFVKVCPQCGSTDITIPKAGMDIRMTIRDMCQTCGAIGNFPEVKVKDIPDFKRKLKK